MLTDLSTDTFFKFTEGKAHVVGKQTVIPGGVVDVYLPTIMGHVVETKDKVNKDTVFLGNLISRFITKDEFTMPKKVKFKNAVTATISEDRVLALANEKARQDYEKAEYPLPLYYIQQSATIEAGTTVTIVSSIGSVKDMYIK